MSISETFAMANELPISPDPTAKATARAISATASALQDVASAQAGLVPGVLGIFNSWSQFGAVGIMSVILAVLVGGVLWSASADRKQHGEDIDKLVTQSAENNRNLTAQSAANLKQALETIQDQHKDNLEAQNRQHDALVKSIEGQSTVMARSIDNLTQELRGRALKPADKPD